jgi:hypothetical protein
VKRQKVGVDRSLGELFDDVRDQVARVAEGRDPVLVGPFTGEVGFELLYWLPLVRWAVREFPQLQGRLVVVSRGGVQHWLSGLDARYVDVFSLYSLEQFTEARGALKNREVSDFDRQVLERVRTRLGASRCGYLHPSLLYELYYQALRVDRHAFVRSLRTDEAGGAAGNCALFEPLPAPELGSLDGVLPDDYVAVRFYFRPSFPETPETRRFAADTIAALARTTTVVMLNNNLAIDDHEDFAELPAGRVVTIDHLMTPENNLHVQTIAISRARAFVGTYGGLAYLPPFLGVPSLSFSTRPDAARPWHFDLAQRAFAAGGWASLVALQPQDLPLIDLVTRDFPFAGSTLPGSSSALSEQTADA